MYLQSEVPLNKGVSSSAAVEVAVMKPAARAYGIDLHGIELAEACQWVENVIAESACGIMDQAAATLGDEDCVLPLLCQPCQPFPLVRLPEELHCWAVDSGVSHAVTGIEYEAARAAAFMGYKLICDWEGLPVTFDAKSRIPRYTDPRWRGYLSEVTPSVFRSKYEWRLPERMPGSEFLRRRAVSSRPVYQRSGPRFRTASATARVTPLRRTSAFSCSWNWRAARRRSLPSAPTG